MSWPAVTAAPEDEGPAAGDASSWLAAATGADVSAVDAAAGCCCATGIGTGGTVTTGVSTRLDVTCAGVAGAGGSAVAVGAV